MKNEYTLTKYECFITGFLMSIVVILFPLLGVITILIIKRCFSKKGQV